MPPNPGEALISDLKWHAINNYLLPLAQALNSLYELCIFKFNLIYI